MFQQTSIVIEGISMKHMLIYESGPKVIPLLRSDCQTYAPNMFKYAFDELIALKFIRDHNMVNSCMLQV